MTRARELAQRQLDAYNAHDIDAFAACYHPDVEVRDFPSQTLRFQGLEELRGRYAPMFENDALHAHLVSRTVHGSVSVDEERVEGIRKGEDVSAVAIYEVEGELIRRVWFIRERE